MLSCAAKYPHPYLQDQQQLRIIQAHCTALGQGSIKFFVRNILVVSERFVVGGSRTGFQTRQPFRRPGTHEASCLGKCWSQNHHTCEPLHGVIELPHAVQLLAPLACRQACTVDAP